MAATLRDHAGAAAGALAMCDTPKAFVLLLNDGTNCTMHQGGSLEDIAYLSMCLQGSVVGRLNGKQTVEKEMGLDVAAPT